MFPTPDGFDIQSTGYLNAREHLRSTAYDHDRSQYPTGPEVMPGCMSTSLAEAACIDQYLAIAENHRCTVSA